jgi:hypothetical protein
MEERVGFVLIGEVLMQFLLMPIGSEPNSRKRVVLQPKSEARQVYQ